MHYKNWLLNYLLVSLPCCLRTEEAVPREGVPVAEGPAREETCSDPWRNGGGRLDESRCQEKTPALCLVRWDSLVWGHVLAVPQRKRSVVQLSPTQYHGRRKSVLEKGLLSPLCAMPCPRLPPPVIVIKKLYVLSSPFPSIVAA